jgi:SWI/SNF-related matrix-associated actin-dependent regulator of chromatin subfamily A-like protein 1
MTLETLVRWSAPKRTTVKGEACLLRTGAPTPAFWEQWRLGKDALKAAGVWCGKDNQTNEWVACWKLPLPAEEVARLSATYEASRASDSDFQPPCPDGLAFLPFQRAGVAFASSRDVALIGDEMGLGKSPQSVGIANVLHATGKPHLPMIVVCPASLKLNWQREILRWRTFDCPVYVVHAGEPLPTDGIAIVNYDILYRYEEVLARTQWAVAIIDEAHLIKNGKTRRAKAIRNIKATRRYALTGTPIPNKVAEIWTTLDWLQPKSWGNAWTFDKRYGYSRNAQLELNRLLRTSIMVRRLKADVLKELPAKRRQVIELEAAGSVRKMIDRLREIVASLHAGDSFEELSAAVMSLSSSAPVMFAEISKIRHEMAIAKVPDIVAHLREITTAENPVIFFCHHLDVARAVLEAFGSEAVSILGETTQEARQAAVDAFQGGKANLFVGTIRAAGVGITLTRSSHVVFGELDWVPANMLQAEDRAHRVGQTESVNIQYLCLAGSLDARMARAICEKQAVATRSLDAAVAAPEAQEAPDWKPMVPRESAVWQPKPIPVGEVDRAFSPAKVLALLEGLRIVAGMNHDKARTRNGVGFSKYDTKFGEDLARQSTLTQRQASAAYRLCLKYQRQIPNEIMEVIER